MKPFRIVCGTNSDPGNSIVVRGIAKIQRSVLGIPRNGYHAMRSASNGVSWREPIRATFGYLP
jgi:hypothetical protein